jgi:serine/threonine protein phosphatase PrpC
LGPEEQIVTAFPDIVEVPITDEHEFILIACDGIWDVLTSEQATAFCRQRLAEGRAPEQVKTYLWHIINAILDMRRTRRPLFSTRL